MRLTTFLLSLAVFISSFIYQFCLLKYIDADTRIWVLWIVTWFLTVLYGISKLEDEEKL